MQKELCEVCKAEVIEVYEKWQYAMRSLQSADQQLHKEIERVSDATHRMEFWTPTLDCLEQITEDRVSLRCSTQIVQMAKDYDELSVAYNIAVYKAHHDCPHIITEINV